VKIKHIFSFLTIISLTFSTALIVLASENIETSNVNITVMLPKPDKPEEPIMEEAIKPPVPILYPISVYETEENGVRQIIRTYELGENESPDYIPRESFERGGIYYELTDIVRNESASTDVREHTESVGINTDTREIEDVIKLLAPSIEFKSDDGFMGILTLNVTSIRVETSGTKKENFTVSATREYPHLSSNDTSLIPKTIIDGGRTLMLAEVDWQTQGGAVNYEEIPISYTAIVKYTATASRTVTTGYRTTAEYTGSISKIVHGKTLYTAIFQGKSPVSELTIWVEEQSVEILESEEPISEEITENMEVDETDLSQKEDEVIENISPIESKINIFLVVLSTALSTIMAVALMIIGAYFLIKKKIKSNFITTLPETKINGGEYDT